MDLHYLLFELKGPDGRIYEIYLDGFNKGFPEGTVISTCATPLFYRGVRSLPDPGSLKRIFDENGIDSLPYTT